MKHIVEAAQEKNQQRAREVLDKGENTEWLSKVKANGIADHKSR